MSRNVGIVDGFLRTVVGGALITFAMVAEGHPYQLFGWIGLVPALTAMMSWCPAYSIIGVSTCKTN